MAAANGRMQIHTGVGKLYCRAYLDRPAGRIPALGQTSHAMALRSARRPKRARREYLVADAETHHAMWHATCIDHDGSDSGVRPVSDADTGRSRIS